MKSQRHEIADFGAREGFSVNFLVPRRPDWPWSGCLAIASGLGGSTEGGDGKAVPSDRLEAGPSISQCALARLPLGFIAQRAAPSAMHWLLLWLVATAMRGAAKLDRGREPRLCTLSAKGHSSRSENSTVCRRDRHGLRIRCASSRSADRIRRMRSRHIQR